MKSRPVLKWCTDYKTANPQATWEDIREAYLQYLNKYLEELRVLYRERWER